ncbi:ABC transporter substrate-binding protein [Thiofilum flexile]|uniref:ABC transporter substrate-binding protein n=1 Tax=Thiofilum flexile TaxID=125627 RepID=UPI00035CD2C6|nr:ABC transporter substrate-binding protein [Thiofilum flexile]
MNAVFRSNRSLKYFATTCLVGLGLLISTQAQALTVISFGGASGDAMKKAYYDPFIAQTKTELTPGDYNGEFAKIRSMVETGNVSWDLVEMESPDLTRGCFEGVFEPLDWDKLGIKDQLMESAVNKCGAGVFVWSTVLAYDGEKLKEAPSSWKDFWDVQKFPGKRGLRKGAKYTLEFALQADGVPAEEVYTVLATPEGVDRAFKKLDELKPHIQWWEAGAQPPQWLVAGDVVMSSAYSGRIAAAQAEGRKLVILWPGSIYDLDYWAIPKGSKNIEAAYEFIKFASQPDTQAAYSSQIPYGPVNPTAIEKLSPEKAKEMPTYTDNLKGALAMGTEFWVDNSEELEQRFNAWAAK